MLMRGGYCRLKNLIHSIDMTGIHGICNRSYINNFSHRSTISICSFNHYCAQEKADASAAPGQYHFPNNSELMKKMPSLLHYKP